MVERLTMDMQNQVGMKYGGRHLDFSLTTYFYFTTKFDLFYPRLVTMVGRIVWGIPPHCKVGISCFFVSGIQYYLNYRFVLCTVRKKAEGRSLLIGYPMFADLLSSSKSPPWILKRNASPPNHYYLQLHTLCLYYPAQLQQCSVNIQPPTTTDYL